MLLTQFLFVIHQEITSACENSHGTLSEDDRGQRMSRAQQVPKYLLVG